MPDVKPPVSQNKPPSTGTTNTTSKPTADPNAPKLESTGVIKDEKGNTLKADEKSPDPGKSGVITGDKSSSSKPKEEESKESNEPFEKSFTKVEGEVLQGDSFRITIQRGRKTIRLPVPIEGTNNVIVLSNTFKLIKEMLEAPTEKELEEKFASFVE